MKIPALIQATLIAISLAGAAQAAAPVAPAAKTTTVEIAVVPAGYAAPESTEEVQPADPAHKDAAQADAAAAPVPEPQVFLMMLAGLVLLGFASSRRDQYEKFTD